MENYRMTKNKCYNIWLGTMLFFALTFFASSSVATPYTISNGDAMANIIPLSDSQTAGEYYSYGGWDGTQSGDPAFGTESGTAFFWLYEDTGDNTSTM